MRLAASGASPSLQAMLQGLCLSLSVNHTDCGCCACPVTSRSAPRWPHRTQTRRRGSGARTHHARRSRSTGRPPGTSTRCRLRQTCDTRGSRSATASRVSTACPSRPARMGARAVRRCTQACRRAGVQARRGAGAAWLAARAAHVAAPCMLLTALSSSRAEKPCARTRASSVSAASSALQHAAARRRGRRRERRVALYCWRVRAGWRDTHARWPASLLCCSRTAARTQHMRTASPAQTSPAQLGPAQRTRPRAPQRAALLAHGRQHQHVHRRTRWLVVEGGGEEWRLPRAAEAVEPRVEAGRKQHVLRHNTSSNSSRGSGSGNSSSVHVAWVHLRSALARLVHVACAAARVIMVACTQRPTLRARVRAPAAHLDGVQVLAGRGGRAARQFPAGVDAAVRRLAVDKHTAPAARHGHGRGRSRHASVACGSGQQRAGLLQRRLLAAARARMSSS